jgi:Rod binding domain-containing protein
MGTLSIPPVNLGPALSAGTYSKSDDPVRLREAATQFEALLIGQLLHSARSDGAGWLGEEDSASGCATDYAEQQFAGVMAQAGGLGITRMIEAGLKARESQPEHSQPTPDSAHPDRSGGRTSLARRSPAP